MSRTKRPVLWITTAAVVVVAAVGLYLFQPWRLFTTHRVDEAAPVVGGQQGAAAALLASGSFISHEHSTSGSVQIQPLAGGKANLRLTNLRTSLDDAGG